MMDYQEIKPKFKKAYPIVYQEKRIIIGGFGKNTVYGGYGTRSRSSDTCRPYPCGYAPNAYGWRQPS